MPSNLQREVGAASLQHLGSPRHAGKPGIVGIVLEKPAEHLRQNAGREASPDTRLRDVGVALFVRTGTCASRGKNRHRITELMDGNLVERERGGGMGQRGREGGGREGERGGAEREREGGGAGT